MRRCEGISQRWWRLAASGWSGKWSQKSSHGNPVQHFGNSEGTRVWWAGSLFAPSLLVGDALLGRLETAEYMGKFLKILKFVQDNIQICTLCACCTCLICTGFSTVACPHKPWGCAVGKFMNIRICDMNIYLISINTIHNQIQTRCGLLALCYTRALTACRMLFWNLNLRVLDVLLDFQLCSDLCKATTHCTAITLMESGCRRIVSGQRCIVMHPFGLIKHACGANKGSIYTQVHTACYDLPGYVLAKLFKLLLSRQPNYILIFSCYW